MNKEGMRGFAGGILFTVIVIAFFYYLVFNIPSQTRASQSISNDTVNTYLKKHEQVAISEEEYGTLKEAAKQAETNDQKETAQNNKDTNSQDTDKEGTENPSVIKYTLVIKSGMTSQDAADQLEKKKIIKNASDLSKYLEKHHLMKYVQIGEFKVSSDMSISEIAHLISK